MPWKRTVGPWIAPEDKKKTGMVERPEDKTFTYGHWAPLGEKETHTGELWNLPAAEWETQVTDAVPIAVEEFAGNAVQEDMGNEEDLAAEEDAGADEDAGGEEDGPSMHQDSEMLAQDDRMHHTYGNREDLDDESEEESDDSDQDDSMMDEDDE